MKRVFLYIFIFLSAFIPGAQAQQSTPSNELKQFVESNNRFGMKYLRMLQTRSPKDNLLIAPTASSLGFALLQNGASDMSNAEIASAFERENLTRDELNAAAKEMIADLAPPAVANRNWNSTLHLSLSLWIRSLDAFRPKIRSIAADSYGATERQLSGNLSADQKAMDAFMTSFLGQKFSIPTPALKRGEFAMVVASHFDGKWHSEFDESRTSPKNFKFRDHVKRPVEMMWKSDRFQYLKGEQFQAAFLPYTERYGMYVFLPDEDDGIDALVGSLTNENWSKWMSMFEPYRKGLLELPKFHVEVSKNSTADYNELGIKEPFANFSAMAELVTSPEGAKLTRVLEDASIDVTEKRTVVITRGLSGGVIGGIEGGVPGAPPPPPPFHMLVDHPFLFAIVDGGTKSILYLGVVTAPPTTKRVPREEEYRKPAKPVIPKMPN